MSRHFLANLSVIVVLNLIIKPVYIFGIEVSVQNAVGAASYGLYFAILNSAYLLQVLNDFGLQIYNNRNVALSSDALRTSFVPILKFKLGLSVLFILLFAALTGILGYWNQWEVVIAVGLNLILMSLLLFLRSNISGLGLYRHDSVLSVLDKAILILVLGYLLFIAETDFTILQFAYAQTGALAITAAVAIGILLTKHSFSRKQDPQEKIISILKNAAPFALAVFLMTIYTRIDGVMIEQLAENGAYQSGAYAAGYRLLDAANMFAYLFAVLLLPMFTRSLNDLHMIRTLLSQGARVMLTLTITVAAACVAFRHEIMALLYTQATSEWGSIFGILIASFIAVGGMYIFGTFLTARGDIRPLNILYLSCVGLNITLNFFMIPPYGAIGAAISTLATQTAATILLIAMTLRNTRTVPGSVQILRTGIYVLLCLAIAFAMIQLPDVNWVVRFCVAAILMPLTALVTGVIRWDELRQFIPE